MEKKQNQRNGFSKAFSFVELMVVIAIIGILAVILITNLNTEKSQKQVEGAALLSAAKIREAQTAALTGRQYVAETTPCSYRVVWNNSQIDIFYKSQDGSENCTVETPMSSTALPAGVSFTGSGSAEFPLPHGQVAVAQVLTLQKGSISQVVCLRTSGLIEAELLASSC